MNTRRSSVVTRWATCLVPTILLTTIVIVPCLIVENCVSARPSVSRVTAYYDPSWKTRTKRTTQVPLTRSPSLLQNPTQPQLVTAVETQVKIQTTTPIPLPQLAPQFHRGQYQYPHPHPFQPYTNHQLNNYHNYNINNTYFPVRQSHSYQYHPQQFTYPLLQNPASPLDSFGDNENLSKQLPPSNKIRRRKRPRNPNNKNGSKNSTNVDVLGKRQSPIESVAMSTSMSMSPTPGELQIGEFNFESADPNPSRRNRRRRLTRRKKVKNKYFRPQSFPNSEIEPENLVSSASIEPFDDGYGYPIINLESLDNSKFRGAPSPLQEPESLFVHTYVPPPKPASGNAPGHGRGTGRHHPSRNAAAEFWTVLTEAPDLKIQALSTPEGATSTTKLPQSTKSKSTTQSYLHFQTEPPLQQTKSTLPPSSQKPNSNSNVVIYQRGTPSYPSRVSTPIPDYNPNHNYGHPQNNNSPSPIPRRRKKIKVNQIQTEKEPDRFELHDLHVGESINPFLNSSTPISNDLRNSIFGHLDLIHPDGHGLSIFSSDTNLRDSSKIPENKTIGIKNTLSDSTVGVKVAPDLHMDLKTHSLLNHDSIISSDYERQVYKSRPRIQVKHSVSVSTSTTVSSPSPATTSNHNQNSNNTSKNHKNIQILHHANNKPTEIEISTTTTTKRTTPIPTSSESSTKSDKTRFHDDGFDVNSKSVSSSTTQKPMITLEDMFALFPNVGAETGRTDPQTNFPFKVSSSATTLKPSSGSGSSGNSATTYKPSFPSSIIFSAGSTTTTRSPLPLTTFAQTRGKAKVETETAVTTSTLSPLILTSNNPVTSIQVQSQSQPKTPFTLRPKPATALPSSSSATFRPSQISSSRSPTSRRTSTTVTPTTLTLTFPTVAPHHPNRDQDHLKINTFLDTIDESGGKNTWTPFQIAVATTKKPTSTTPLPSSSSSNSGSSQNNPGNAKTKAAATTDNDQGTTTVTLKPTEKIQINKDPPLILMPPFTNDKEEPKPVTYTTPEPVTIFNNNNAQNDQLLLKHLLGELGISGDDLDLLNSTPAPPPSTTVKKHIAAQELASATAERTTAKSTTKSTTTTTTTTTTTRRPTVRVTSTQPPRPTQADLFNLFNLFAPQTNAPAIGQGQIQGQRPTPAAALNPTTANDFLNLLNLFQPSTPAPRPLTTQAAAPAANNDIFNLFNLFQPQAATPRTTPPPPPAQPAGGINDLFNIFNLFTTPPPLRQPAPQTVPVTAATRRPAPPVTPAPAANDILGLLNLLQPQTGGQQAQGNPQQGNQQGLEALVQQALLESLGLNGAGGLFSPQATNLNHQLINPSVSPGALVGAGKGTGATGAGNNGLSDSDLKSIFALIDQQKAETDAKNASSSATVSASTTKGNSSSTTKTKDGSTIVLSTPVTTVAPQTKGNGDPTKTTTLMPIFRNMLNLFGITDPTSLKTTLGTLPPAVNASLQSLLDSNNSSVASQAPASSSTSAVNETDLLLQLINANTNANAHATTTKQVQPTTKAPASSSAVDPSLDLLSQLLNLGQVVENTKTSTKPAPVRTQQPQLQLQQQQGRQPALDIQSILAQSWLANAATSPKPEVAPSESNLFNIIANQFTPRPQKPNGLYYWVDLNAFMGEQGGNPLGGIRPKLGHKDYFLKVKREASPDDKTTGTAYPNTNL